MIRRAAEWWRKLCIQHKLWTVLLLLCVPLTGGLARHLYVVQNLLDLQQQRHDLILAHEQVRKLRRLAIDIEDGFRGYVLTQQDAFLTPLKEAERRIDRVMTDTNALLARVSGSSEDLRSLEGQLKKLLQSKHELIADIEHGNLSGVLSYVQSGEGLRLSDAIRKDLRRVEDRLEQQRELLNTEANALSQRTFIGLWVALAGVVILGWGVSRILARSLTNPIMRLQSATKRIGARVDKAGIAKLLESEQGAGDELGQLARSYLDMAQRIEIHVKELEALDAIGHEINTIGPDGLDGVLRRITDRAVELVKADVCLVLLRNESMGCWVVEAASGEWNDSLKNSIMLWEELPVSVRAFDTGEASVGEHFRSDERPQVSRRNLIGDSMLAIPLLSQGVPFGVLSLLSERSRSPEEWNQRLAIGLAQEAALAISNVRLYEAVQQKQRGLQARLRQLEYLAETLAHDLKGPGSRMEELAELLSDKFKGQVDDRTDRWLMLMKENGRDIVRRVEGILEVARVGVGQGAVGAVDPTLMIDQVLKAHAGELERLRAEVRVDSALPLVACHGAYLRQVFDNLISNALKYSHPDRPPTIHVSVSIEDHMACFSVQDNGIGIPPAQHERIFQPFVRLTPSEAKGSGIGLAIVQRIVELYGGRVWIDDCKVEGCTVKFTIPCLGQESAGGPQANEAVGSSEVVKISTPGLL
ncbi:ATP-binding protein [Petrachloros mirabilis]